MVEVDVVTGDYLAELTMLILGRDQMQGPVARATRRTFVRQVEDCLGLALERGVRIVSNAGGLNPAGLVGEAPRGRDGLGLDPAIAWVDGDNLLAARRGARARGGALTANAYLGAFGIARALGGGRRHRRDRPGHRRLGGRSGPRSGATAGHRSQYDELAGAVVAGHVIECGTQATGGNFSGFLDLPRDGAARSASRSRRSAADGSSVITKHDGTGGLVSVDTVTAQLMYEVQSHHYLGPDVDRRPRHDPAGRRRVRTASRVSGVRGSAPPEQLKVCVNELGGFRNQVEFVLTGLDVEEKAAWVRAQLDGAAPRVVGDLVDGRGSPATDADTEEGASAACCAAWSRTPTPTTVGRAFTGAASSSRWRPTPASR